VHRLIVPEPLQVLPLGVLAAFASGLVNLLVGQLLFRASRRSGSIVVYAHGELFMADFWTCAAVLVGLAAVSLTSIQIFDPLVALLVAAKIIWTGLKLLRASFDGLMDHALPLAEQAAVRAAIESQLELGMDYHALRTRLAGSRRFADFHMLVPGALSVRDAHEVANRIEDAVRQALPGIEVAIHIEPIEERAAWEDSALVAIEQAERDKTDKSNDQIRK
jgi:cation diffusion facilitator family transporter